MGKTLKKTSLMPKANIFLNVAMCNGLYLHPANQAPGVQTGHIPWEGRGVVCQHRIV